MLCTADDHISPISMNMTILWTERLELIPVTKELCTAELSSSKELGEKLNAFVPDAWPPALVTPETLQEFIALLAVPGGSRFFAYYWVTTGNNPGGRILIGSGGILIKEDRVPELGYSVLDEFQCRGYGTEAVRMIIEWLKREFSPAFIRAYTFPFLIGSIRVLQKNGFVFEGSGPEEGMIEFRTF